jgi:hypothetical protein
MTGESERIIEQRRHVVYPGTVRFSLDTNTEAIPIADLMADIAKPS